jgi:hypothetical protein
VKIRWRQYHKGQKWVATVDGKLVAEVVPYGIASRRYWAAWVGRKRIDNCPTDIDAKAAVELHFARLVT